MSTFESLSWPEIASHFSERVTTSKYLAQLYMSNRIDEFAELAVGLNDSTGNYSANQYGLGGPILKNNRNSQMQIFKLAGQFLKLKSARTVPEIINKAQIAYLGIGIGSEISCMMNPSICWVANTRTTWAHLVIEYDDNIGTANEALKLYRSSDTTSKMAYQIWADMHARLETSMTRLYEMGRPEALRFGIEPSQAKYLWADAISNNLYDLYHSDKA